MTRTEKKDRKIEFNEKNLLLVLCRRICTAMIALTVICVVCAVIANSYDDKVFSPEFQQTGGYVFVDYFFSKLLYGIFGNWSAKFYTITFLLMFVLIVLKVVLNTIFNIKWKNFINEKNNPRPVTTAPEAAVVSTVPVQTTPVPEPAISVQAEPVEAPAQNAPVTVTPVPVAQTNETVNNESTTETSAE